MVLADLIALVKPPGAALREDVGCNVLEANALGTRLG